jgi:hypothetical protein
MIWNQHPFLATIALKLPSLSLAKVAIPRAPYFVPFEDRALCLLLAALPTERMPNTNIFTGF